MKRMASILKRVLKNFCALPRAFQVQTLSGKVVELERRHRSVSPPPSPRRSSTPRPFSPPPPLLSHPSTSSIGATYPAPFGVANSAPSLYNVVRESGGSFQIEEMQSQLKQKVGARSRKIARSRDFRKSWSQL